MQHEYPKTIRRLAEDLSVAEDVDDARLGLEAIGGLRMAIRANEPVLVSMARDDGVTWEEIARLTGMSSRQAAHRKWRSEGIA